MTTLALCPPMWAKWLIHMRKLRRLLLAKAKTLCCCCRQTIWIDIGMRRNAWPCRAEGRTPPSIMQPCQERQSPCQDSLWENTQQRLPPNTLQWRSFEWYLAHIVAWAMRQHNFFIKPQESLQLQSVGEENTHSDVRPSQHWLVGCQSRYMWVEEKRWQCKWWERVWLPSGRWWPRWFPPSPQVTTLAAGNTHPSLVWE